MNKSDLLWQLSARCGITYGEAERVFNTFISIIYQELKIDGVVNISGFGKFKVSHREARIGVNPRNPSQRITIPKLNTPKFVSGEAFKKAVALKK
jgi:nucleoid DNA-binding protein